jgi:hypothetical protein
MRAPPAWLGCRPHLLLLGRQSAMAGAPLVTLKR